MPGTLSRNSESTLIDVTTLLYKEEMPKPLQIGEARKRLSQLVERVARGGAPVTIGRYGRERAVLVSADEFARLKAPKGNRKPRSLEGTLELLCTPEELIEESHRLGEMWLKAFEKSADRDWPLPRRRKK